MAKDGSSTGAKQQLFMSLLSLCLLYQLVYRGVQMFWVPDGGAIAYTEGQERQFVSTWESAPESMSQSVNSGDLPDAELEELQHVVAGNSATPNLEFDYTDGVLSIPDNNDHEIGGSPLLPPNPTADTEIELPHMKTMAELLSATGDDGLQPMGLSISRRPSPPLRSLKELITTPTCKRPSPFEMWLATLASQVYHQCIDERLEEVLSEPPPRKLKLKAWRRGLDATSDANLMNIGETGANERLSAPVTKGLNLKKPQARIAAAERPSLKAKVLAAANKGKPAHPCAHLPEWRRAAYCGDDAE